MSVVGEMGKRKPMDEFNCFCQMKTDKVTLQHELIDWKRSIEQGFVADFSFIFGFMSLNHLVDW